MEKEKTHTIVLIENYWSGYFQSLVWFVSLALMMGFAVWIDSSAMQWVMGVLWFLALVGWANEQTKSKRLTPKDAIERIKQIQGD